MPETPAPSERLTLVTGASGFLGAHLTLALSGQGKKVRALYHRNSPDPILAALPGVSWMQADLLDVYDVAEVLEGVHDVYHCAAIVSFDPADRYRLLAVNAESTANLVDAAVSAGVRKLAHVSSVAALGRNAATSVITEEEQWEEGSSGSAYAQSKRAAELEVWRGVGEGLDAVMLNPGIILGAAPPGAGADFWTKGSARLMYTAWKEFPYYTGGVTSFVDVADVVHAAVLLMESVVTAERFILSAGNFSFREVFTKMAEALGKKPPHIKAGPFLSGLVWRGGAFRRMFTGKAGSVTRETAATAQRQSIYDNSKLLTQFPEFHYRSLDATVAAMAASFKDRPLA